MLAFFGAMRQEVADLRRHMALDETLAQQGCLVYKGKHGNREVLVVETGIGNKRAERATELVLDSYPVTTVVSLGFGGALDEETKAGDIIICSTLFDDRESGAPCCSDANLISLAEQALDGVAMRLLLGSSVTVVRPVSEPETKRALGKAFSAKVVDMESYCIGRIASARQVPFLAVRAISDTVADRLPPFDRFLDSQGTWRWKRAALYFLLRPHQLIVLCRFYINARKAGKNLSRLVTCLIPKLQES
jgi:adenosylhomocysteine nucleosidase